MWSVVVVDDEKNFCTLLSEYIHALAPRFQVAACFQDGRAAWNFLRNHNVDLVISDVRMPHMSGLDLAQRLFADDRSIPVVLISGYSEFEYAKQAIQYGVVNYLLKPVDFEELRETLARLDKQLLSRHKSENAEGQAALFLFYAISGLFASQETLLRAAALAGAPFQPETDGFALLEVRVNASAQNVERENMGLILETLLRGPFAGNHIYRVYEAADAFYFVAVGPHAPDAETQAGAWRAALEEVADFSVSLVILAQAAGLFLALAVGAGIAARLHINARGDGRADAQHPARGGQQELGRGGDHKVVRALLCKVPRAKARGVFPPEILDEALRAVQTGQERKKRLLERLLAAAPQRVARRAGQLARQASQQLRAAAQAVQPECARAVTRENGVVKIVHVHGATVTGR